MTHASRRPNLPVLLIVALVLFGLFLLLKASFTLISLVFTLFVLAGVVLLLRHTLRKRRA